MTIQDFTTLYNEERKRKYPYKHAVTFSIMKSKVTKKGVITYDVDQYGRPFEVSRTPTVSIQQEDTNGKTVLFQAMWEFFIGTKLKRISSEGRYRKGIGYIQSPNSGHSDLSNGRYYIEVKKKGEKHLPSQVKFAEWVRFNGDVYVTVETFDDMMCVINAKLTNDDSLIEHLFAMRVPKSRMIDKPLFN